jgi:hypothetical protein
MRKPNIIQGKVSGSVYNLCDETWKGKKTINITNAPWNHNHQNIEREKYINPRFRLRVISLGSRPYDFGYHGDYCGSANSLRIKQISKNPDHKQKFYDRLNKQDSTFGQVNKNSKKSDGKREPPIKPDEDSGMTWDKIHFMILCLLLVYEACILLMSGGFHLLISNVLDIHNIAFITHIQAVRFGTAFVCFGNVIFSYLLKDDDTDDSLLVLCIAFYCIIPMHILYSYTPALYQNLF